MVAVDVLRRRLAPMEIAGSVVLIPIANESAYRRDARTGDDELDLARTFPGKREGTFTERLAAELNAEIRAAHFLIDLHTGGKMLDLLPLAGFMLHDDEAILAQQRQMAEAFNLPIVWGTSAALDGRSLSAARDARVPAIYAEHGGGSGFRPQVVDDYVAGCLRVIDRLGLAKCDEAQLMSRVRHRINERSAGSGHLQACHPAPSDGIFIPTVRLGQHVRAGEVLGQVVDLHGDERRSVTAERDGIVLTLCVAAHVQRGTGLCVLIDSPEGDT
jgi:predicted deacylase